MAKMVDMVKTIMNKPEQIRNIAIAAHIDHGKTTFSDNLLAGAGMMSDELAGKACALDFHSDEQERGITIDSASVNMVHKVNDKEFLINLIDTPGHVDFGGDVTRAMRAVDGAVVLCCASEGIMPQTETVLRQALKERVKPILFINKTDRLIRELKLTPEQMQERFVKIITHVNKLIMDIAEEGYGEKWQVNVQDGSVCFGSAFHNWALSLDYMKKKKITFKEIIDAYENDTWKELGKKAPLHEVVLDSVIKHLPNPVKAQVYRIPKIWHGDVESPLGKSLVATNPNGPLAFVVIKVVIDPQAGEICTGRIFSGTMKKGTQVHLNIANTDLRTQQVYAMNGAKREIVDEVPAGNIIGLGGLKGAYPGETVSLEECEPFEAIKHIFEPVMTKSVNVKNPADLPKMVEVLMQVGKEDPSVKIEINQETGEYLLHGMGELHLEVIENRIKTEKKVDIVASPPIVVYRETIRKASPNAVEGKSPNKHNKIYVRVEPMEEEVLEAINEGKIKEGRIKKKDQEIWDSFINAGYDAKTARSVKAVHNGNILIDNTRGIVNIGEVMEMIVDTFIDVVNAGPLAREPCIKVKVILDDLKLHEDAIHRGPAQMYPAVRESVRGAMMEGSPLFYEPIQTLLFEAPAEFMGEISKIISNKRGQLLDMQQEGEVITVKGKLPVGEMFGLASEVRSGTGGRGSFYVVDQAFEPLPMELQDKIKRNIRSRKGIDLDSTIAKVKSN